MVEPEGPGLHGNETRQLQSLREELILIPYVLGDTPFQPKGENPALLYIAKLSNKAFT